MMDMQWIYDYLPYIIVGAIAFSILQKVMPYILGIKKKTAKKVELQRSLTDRLFDAFHDIGRLNMDDKRKYVWLKGDKLWGRRRVGIAISIIPTKTEYIFIVKRSKLSVKKFMLMVEPEFISDLNTDIIEINSPGLITYDGNYNFVELPEELKDRHKEYRVRREHFMEYLTHLINFADLQNDLNWTIKQALRGNRELVFKELAEPPVRPEIDEQEAKRMALQEHKEIIDGKGKSPYEVV